MSGAEVLRQLLGHASPRILLVLLATAATVRLALGAFSPADLIAAAAVAAWWPFQEWILHRTLLHMGPVRVLGRRVDFEFARRHRAHHLEPERTDLIVLPVWVHVVSLAALAGLLLLLPTARLGWTVIAAATAMALQYEWTHFAVHSRYRARGARLQRIRRHHLLHHAKSERFWFGFTAIAVDRLLGTAPDPHTVPTSATCRTLGFAPEPAAPAAKGVAGLLVLLLLPAALARPAVACPPRDLPGLEPNGIELSLGTTNVNAAVGGGGLTAALSRCGEITALKWPGPGSYDQLTYLTDNVPEARSLPHAGALDEMGAFVGLAWEDEEGGGFGWLRDEPWVHAQRYRSSTSGVVENSFAHPTLGLEVVQTTWVVPGADVLGVHLAVHRDPASAVGRARLVLYANLAPTLARLPEFPVADTGLDHQNDFAVVYDRRSRALLHFVPASGRDFALVDPILASPPEDPEALATAVEALVDRLDEPGIYLALAARGGDSGFQAGFDDSPLCAHQSALAERAVDSLGFPDALSAAARAIFVCERTVAHPDGPLAACRAQGGWRHAAESAYEDAGDGRLSGSPIAACQANAALAREVAFSGGRGSATFYVSAAATRDEALRLLADARGARSAEQQIAAADGWWARWLAPAILPDTDDPEVLRFARRALISLRTATDAASGAMVASVATQPPYGLDWPRDGAFFNHALDLAGYPDLVTAHNLFYARVQRRDFEPWSIAYSFVCPSDPAARSYPDCVPPGTFAMNYYTDPDEAVPGGPISFEIDEAALGVWTLWDHAAFLADRGQRRAYLDAVCPAIERGATTLAACRDPASGLPCPASEDDNVELTQQLQGAETVLLALRSAVAAANDCGFTAEQAAAWDARAAELEDAILASFLVPDPIAHLAGPRRAWVLWPVRLLPPDDPLMRSQAELVRRESIAPVLERSAPGAGYNGENVLARARLFRALGDPIGLAATQDETRALLHLLATPDTGHLAEFAARVDADLDGDGEAPDYLPQNDVPHVWQQALLYLAAMASFGERDAPAPRPCDATGDGTVDGDDVAAVRRAAGRIAAGPLDPRDADEDGAITLRDAVTCRARCDLDGCGAVQPQCARLAAGVPATAADPRLVAAAAVCRELRRLPRS